MSARPAFRSIMRRTASARSASRSSARNITATCTSPDLLTRPDMAAILLDSGSLLDFLRVSMLAC